MSTTQNACPLHRVGPSRGPWVVALCFALVAVPIAGQATEHSAPHPAARGERARQPRFAPPGSRIRFGRGPRAYHVREAVRSAQQAAAGVRFDAEEHRSVSDQSSAEFLDESRAGLALAHHGLGTEAADHDFEHAPPGVARGQSEVATARRQLREAHRTRETTRAAVRRAPGDSTAAARHATAVAAHHDAQDRLDRAYRTLGRQVHRAVAREGGLHE